MKEELLNEFAETYWQESDHGLLCKTNCIESFKAGARWHESLPLADRLSESEKDKIIVMHNIAKDWASEDNSGRCYAIYRDIERIFGKDLFTKTE